MSQAFYQEGAQGQECLETLGAEELSDISDRKVAGVGEGQLRPSVLPNTWVLQLAMEV